MEPLLRVLYHFAYKSTLIKCFLCLDRFLLFFSDPEVNNKTARTLPRTRYGDVIKVALFLGNGSIYQLRMAFCVEECQETLCLVQLSNETIVPLVVTLFIFFPARGTKVHGSNMYPFQLNVVIIHFGNKCLHSRFQHKFDQKLITFVKSSSPPLLSSIFAMVRP